VEKQTTAIRPTTRNRSGEKRAVWVIGVQEKKTKGGFRRDANRSREVHRTLGCGRDSEGETSSKKGRVKGSRRPDKSKDKGQ